MLVETGLKLQWHPVSQFKKEKGKGYNSTGQSNLEESGERETVSLVAHHWPSTQPDPVGIFAFECYNNTIEYPKCNESTPINGYDILYACHIQK